MIPAPPACWELGVALECGLQELGVLLNGAEMTAPHTRTMMELVVQDRAHYNARVPESIFSNSPRTRT